jgi:hypothetical protein
MKSMRRESKGQKPKIFLRPEKHGQLLRGIPKDLLVLTHQLPKKSVQGRTPVEAEIRKMPTSHRDIFH